ncbi:MAG: N-acetylmuramoyl-L-alanine amidase [Roseburia sp.]|nr:N-acetylmuramoyl-L-alanine amidase [Roseburia sp.]MCM1096725.1 N-acetylmuramoyl-L-alanine amidase [Ruminococcus flavefaciens]
MKKRRGRWRKENMKAVCAVWTLIFTGCMAVMLLFASKKAIVIADVPQEQPGLSGNSPQQDAAVRQARLRLEQESGVGGSFRIPLPKEIRAENITMENRYMSKELWLYIQGGEEDFFTENAVSGDISGLLSGRCEEQEDGVILKLSLSRVMEYRSTLEGGVLKIVWYEPHELYDYVVVLDPAWETAGIEKAPGADITLQVAKQVQKKLALENVRLYLVRPDEKEAASGDRTAFAEEVKADLYLRLSVSEADTEESYGIQGFYNDEYFIPEFGNADLADLLTRSVTVAASNRAVGLNRAGEGSILKELRIPAAEVSLGYLSNPQEKYLLEQEAYQEKLADGILGAVSEAVERLKR